MNPSTYRTKLTRHIQGRVALALGVSRSHVSMVVNGHRQSRRVEEAMAKAYEIVERKVQRFARKSERRAA